MEPSLTIPSYFFCVVPHAIGTKYPCFELYRGVLAIDANKFALIVWPSVYIGNAYIDHLHVVLLFSNEGYNVTNHDATVWEFLIFCCNQFKQWDPLSNANVNLN